ncbi:uncharacterized protein LOC105420315 [Amborella trichopoda]|uniref:uncharacterized protein LOC105420315 n=1 Tax=Amborella trichopoda TaxID=13333 RepID=UPI0009BD2F4F|nr:uncharacterized protein LOC105420315 [Amborella trichopoda]|eukprot:XP_020520345.1 uncharacterized protein LOC105420315 [Amborella trichopoda]
MRGGGEKHSTTYKSFTLHHPKRSEVKTEMRGGGEKHSTTYKSFTLHRPKRWHVLTGKGMCFIMWSTSSGHLDHANIFLRNKSDFIGSAMVEFGELLTYEASRDWLMQFRV